ncbi:hypothetical protein [Flavobacterium sp.]|jgi:hypothetical protein|uniref:hypothetical protein n=1 Tax=Flavobacterium sp. TaxID=239 RepID=UPI0037BEDFFB
MYIKLKNGQIDQYPYFENQLKSDNPDTSFPEVMPESLLAEWGVYPVEATDYPQVDHTKNVKEGTPVNNNGWKQVWEVTDASPEEVLQRVLQLRADNYPPMSDYIDGVVKGDQAQIDKYIADCLAVKAKYPKP